MQVITSFPTRARSAECVQPNVPPLQAPRPQISTVAVFSRRSAQASAQSFVASDKGRKLQLKLLRKSSRNSRCLSSSSRRCFRSKLPRKSSRNSHSTTSRIRFLLLERGAQSCMISWVSYVACRSYIACRMLSWVSYSCEGTCLRPIMS